VLPFHFYACNVISETANEGNPRKTKEKISQAWPQNIATHNQPRPVSWGLLPLLCFAVNWSGHGTSLLMALSHYQ
jgi:hypothetical protein